MQGERDVYWINHTPFTDFCGKVNLNQNQSIRIGDCTSLLLAVSIRHGRPTVILHAGRGVENKPPAGFAKAGGRGCCVRCEGKRPEPPHGNGGAPLTKKSRSSLASSSVTLPLLFTSPSPASGGGTTPASWL